MANKSNFEISDQLHSIAIHLLRMVSTQDQESGLTPRRLSVLSVIVFAGPISINKLAEAERVRPPTISRMVKDLEWEGLIERTTDQKDKRIQLIKSTERGRDLMEAGRQRRISTLAQEMEKLDSHQIQLVNSALPTLQKLTLPRNHPHLQNQDLL